MQTLRLVLEASGRMWQRRCLSALPLVPKRKYKGAKAGEDGGIEGWHAVFQTNKWA